MTITLPPEYPDHKPALIEHISAKASWLSVPQSEQLEAHLLSLWQPGIQVLYEWLESIRSGQCLTDLGLLSSENILRYQPKVEQPSVTRVNNGPLFLQFTASITSYSFSTARNSCSKSQCASICSDEP